MRSLCIALLFALLGTAFAQSVEVRVGATPAPAAQVSYVLAPSWGEARIGVAYANYTGLLSASFTAHAAASAISNLTFDGALDARLDGNLQGMLGVRGTIGPIAARFTVRGFTTNEDAFWRTPQLSPLRPAGRGFSAELSATYRSGDLVYTLLPTYTLTSRGQYVNILGEVRWLRAIERHEVRFAGEFWGGADWTQLEGRAGATLVLNRGRKPAWEFGALFTVNEFGVTPGVHFAVTEQLSGGKSVRVAGAVTPRSVVKPLAALEVSAQLPAGAQRWHLAGEVTYDGAKLEGAAEVRFVIPLNEAR